MKIKVGTSGFGVAQTKYVELFSCVEVQHTFYQPPRLSTLERWRAAAPPDFEYVLKAWQLITHDAKSPTYRRLKKKLSEVEKQEAGYFRPTPIVREAWETTLACAKALQARTILFQCPASFRQTKENISNLENFFASVDRCSSLLSTRDDDGHAKQRPDCKGGLTPRAALEATRRGTACRAPTTPESNRYLDSDASQLNFAWEPRGDWDSKVVKRICNDLNLWHAVDPFNAKSVTPDRLYFRLHGRNGWRYEYEEGELRELAAMLNKSEPRAVATGFTRITSQTKQPYVFFNNARMTQDASRFKSITDPGAAI